MLKVHKVSKFFGTSENEIGQQLAQEKAWFLSHERSVSDIHFNMEGDMCFATLDALVERLTLHDAPVATDFLKAFMICFRCFCTPQNLVKLLEHRFLLRRPRADERRITGEERLLHAVEGPRTMRLNIEAMRQEGSVNGRQIVPVRFVRDTLQGGDQAAWKGGDMALLFPDGAYRNKWYATGDEHDGLCAIGIHGQWLFVAPKRGVTLVKLGLLRA